MQNLTIVFWGYFSNHNKKNLFNFTPRGNFKLKKKPTQNNVSFGFRHCSPTRVPSINFCHYLSYTLGHCCLRVKAGLHSGQVASSSQRQPTITLKCVPIGNLQQAFSLMLMALHSGRKAYYRERDPHISHLQHSFFVKILENKKTLYKHC